MKNQKFSFSFSKILRGVSLVQKIFFTSQLEVMVRTGFPLTSALSTIEQQIENPKFAEIIRAIRKDIEKGSPFSTACQRYPKVFPEIFTSMIAAGETSGKLTEVLKHLTMQMKKSHILRVKVKNALTYPAVIFTAMVMTGIGMMVFVIPKITSIYSEAGAELPLPTKILIGITQLMIRKGPFIGIFLVVALVFVIRFIRTQKGRRMFHAILLRLPMVGKILKKINLATFGRNLGSLLKTNIPIVETFQIIARTQGNMLYRVALSDAAEELKKGISVREVLGRSPALFPPLVTQMVHIGEESGTLDTIVGEMADFYESEVSETLENLTTIIEPVLILVLGVAVGGVAVAVIMPIYSLVRKI